jgi:hypothetical protein
MTFLSTSTKLLEAFVEFKEERRIQYTDTECAESKLVGCARSFQECLIGTHCRIPQQTEGYSFGNHVIQ